MKKLILILYILLSYSCFSQVIFDFESGLLEGWAQNPPNRWGASSSQPLNGSYSLKHTFDSSIASTDVISRELPSWDIAKGDVTWRVKVRHGFDPSSSNRWWIFLMSDSPEMGANPTCSGYAVGVNLTGSDDMLKLWRIDGGTPQVVLATSISWQNDIGKNGIGAIEVTRDTDGKFTVKASTNGSFSGLTSMGSVNDNRHSSFNFFGICYNYTASADQLLWVDDVTVGYDPLNPNDNTSTIENPMSQIPPGIIPSTLNNPNAMADVLRFTINDDAANDHLPTIVTRLVVENASSSDTKLTEIIGGVRLTGHQGGLASTMSQIDDSKITISIYGSSMIVPDGQSDEFTLAIYLKPEGLTDGAKLKFAISQSDHGCKADVQGSGFAPEFPSAVISSEFKVDVKATRLSYAYYPTAVSINKPFSLTITGADLAGNTDTDFSKPVSLQTSGSTGTLAAVSGLTKTPENGVAQWDDLTINSHEPFTILASSSGFSPVNGPTIQVANDSSTHILKPETQPVGRTIFSYACFPSEAVEVLRFTIFDNGEADGVPTLINSMRFNRTATEGIASLSKTVEGILVRVNGILAGTSSLSVSTSSITASFSEGAITIPNGQGVDLSIWVYLKQSGITDNQVLQLAIDSVNHGFTTFASGSAMVRTLTNSIKSNPFPIAVNATKLAFKTLPERVGLLEPFGVVVNAADSNGNTDTDFNGLVSISTGAGTGNLSVNGNATRRMAKGECRWDTLRYNAVGTFAILAQNATLNGALSASVRCGDADGQVTGIDFAPNEVSIPGTTTSEEEAVEVLRLKLTDQGTSDGLPLIPERITLRCFDPSGAKMLARQIARFLVKSEANSIVPASFTTNDKGFELTLPTGSLIIANGTSTTISILVFLRKGEVADGTRFQFYIPSDNHGWKSGMEGTAFAEKLVSTIYGPMCHINVEAKMLVFAEQPYASEIAMPFTLKIAATDTFGNIDTDYNKPIAISKHSGYGNLTCSNTVQNALAGISTFTGVSFDKFGDYKLMATSGSLWGSTSPKIFCGSSQECIVNEDFEVSTPPAWPGIDSWVLSTVSPLGGAQSLQHRPNFSNGTSILLFPSPIVFDGEGFVQWEFCIRNGDWDPSSDNTFCMVLLSDSEQLIGNSTNGLAVGINPSASSDLLTLWGFDKGKNTPLITTGFDWNENDMVTIRIGLSPKREMILWYAPNRSEKFSYGGSSKVPIGKGMKWSGVVFNYTASRSGQLWLDNLRICTTNYPPTLLSAHPMNMLSTRVTFTEQVNETDAMNPNNYTIHDNSGGLIPIDKVIYSPGTPRQVILRTNKLPYHQLWLRVSGIKDSQGFSLTDSIPFGLGQEGALGRLVVNEVMANPMPSKGLPEYEYIELYNPTPDTVLTEGWRMQFNTKLVLLPADTIPPHQYCLLGTSASALAYAGYGKTIPVSGFPSLLNDGMLLKLIDGNGSLVSFVDYKSSWFTDEAKQQGGYSLERVDYRNLAGGEGNWKGSLAQAGGTPCAANSVVDTNPDETPPRILYHKVVSSSQIELGFSEPMDSLMLTLPDNYSLDHGIGKPEQATITDALYSRVLLSFSIPFDAATLFNLNIANELTDFSGNHLPATNLIFGLPQTPASSDIVINEVLFNPYAGGVDFVEIYNNSAKCFDLQTLSLANRSQNSNVINQVYPTADTARLLFPGEYAVITVNPLQVTQFYAALNPTAFVRVSNMPSYNSDKGNVVLLNQNFEIVDEVRYSESMHFKLLKDVKGVSLERIHFDLPSGSTSTWHSASQAAGFATPTYKNSQWVEPAQRGDNFTLSPETFSPDGDGKDDFLSIGYQLPEAGFTANIRVFNSSGVEVRRVATNEFLGTGGTIKWDGLNNSNQVVPMGIYIVFIEYFNLRGEVFRLKKTCVVAVKL
jgi:hypothetical protein